MKREVTRIEKDDKKLNRYNFDGDVRAWDLSTGQLRETFKHDPPRGILGMTLAPDGATLATFEMLSTESGQQPETSASLWDLTTKKFRPLADKLNSWAVYSCDGKTLAAPARTGAGQAVGVKLIDVATAQETASIPITEQNVELGYIALSPDSSLLVGQVRSLDSQTKEHWLKFWDVASGQELGSIAGEKKHVFLHMTFSQDGQMLAVTNSLAINDPTGNQGKLFLFDVPTKKLVTVIHLGEQASAGKPAFSPDGKWLAVVTRSWPEWPPPRDPDPMDFPQARVLLVDVGAGEVRETLVAPHGFGSSACFSPDGKMFATAGSGKVLLWDLTSPPGISRAHDE